MNNLVQQLS